MDQETRLSLIEDMTKTMALVTVQNICDTFQVSRDTARRDLVKLEQQGRITRTRGGAVSSTIQTYVRRKEDSGDIKRKLAQAASPLPKDGDLLFMDSSTSVALLAEFIGDRALTIVTHSLHISQAFSHLPKVELVLLGGRLHPRDQYVYGSSALDALDQYRADWFFTGACGIEEGEITGVHWEDALIKRKMIARSRNVIMLADHSKWNVDFPYKVGRLEEVDILFTDRELPLTAGTASKPKEIYVVP
ncbi:MULTISPECIES: DeoR/GlpR family DNA-binding transcription regulator [Paenibacillus]|uniref:DeoR/GlpR family DNA-binding transcription regulator n=1 Tax=Paenibacillus TaxID=44249 RepID=UPI002FE0166C